MNSVKFSRSSPEVNVPRASVVTADARGADPHPRFKEDQEAFRARRVSLRDYEARLRVWQAGIGAGRERAGSRVTSTTPVGKSSHPPFDENAGLQMAWEELHRVRELVEAWQLHLRETRITLRDRKASLKKQQDGLNEREARLVEREELVAAASAQPIACEHTLSAMTRLTRSPFDMAR